MGGSGSKDIKGVLLKGLKFYMHETLENPIIGAAWPFEHHQV